MTGIKCIVCMIGVVAKRRGNVRGSPLELLLRINQVGKSNLIITILREKSPSITTFVKHANASINF